MPPQDDVADALCRLYLVVLRDFGAAPVDVTIRLAEAKRAIRLPIPHRAYVLAMEAARAPAASTTDDVSRLALRILRAAAETEKPTAEKITETARMESVPYVKKWLTILRKDGLVGGTNPANDYPITAKGLAALEKRDEPTE